MLFSVNNPICVCDEGYEGVSCTSDIDECDTAPCGDGGRCSTPNANSYECKSVIFNFDTLAYHYIL